MTGTPPSVSVVLATFNGAAYLGEQLASLAGQSVLPAELVASDDGSQDETVEILERFARGAPFPVRLLEGPRRGLGENFWRAARSARGETIAWCDQDDLWAPDKLERCLAALESHGASFVSHAALVTDRQLQPTGRRFPAYHRDRVRRSLEGDPWFVPPGFATVFRRQLLEQAAWDQRPRSHQNGAPLSHDHAVSLLAFGCARRVELQAPLARYRQHGANAAGAPRLHGLAKVRYALAIPPTQYEELAAIAAENARYLACCGVESRRAEEYFERARARCERRAAIHQAAGRRAGAAALAAALGRGDFRPRGQGGFGPQGLARDAVGLLLGLRS